MKYCIGKQISFLQTTVILIICLVFIVGCHNTPTVAHDPASQCSHPTKPKILNKQTIMAHVIAQSEKIAICRRLLGHSDKLTIR